MRRRGRRRHRRRADPERCPRRNRLLRAMCVSEGLRNRTEQNTRLRRPALAWKPGPWISICRHADSVAGDQETRSETSSPPTCSLYFTGQAYVGAKLRRVRGKMRVISAQWTRLTLESAGADRFKPVYTQRQSGIAEGKNSAEGDQCLAVGLGPRGHSDVPCPRSSASTA